MCSTHDTHTREALGTLPIHACPSACFNLRITGRISIQSYVHVTSLSFDISPTFIHHINKHVYNTANAVLCVCSFTCEPPDWWTLIFHYATTGHPHESPTARRQTRQLAPHNVSKLSTVRDLNKICKFYRTSSTIWWNANQNIGHATIPSVSRFKVTTMGPTAISILNVVWR